MAQVKPKKPTEILTGQTAFYAPKCPHCGVAVDLQATVEEFGTPQGWQFYGYQGERWIKCTGLHGVYEFTHFVTVLNGRHSNRLAWRKLAAPDEEMEQGFLL